MNMDLDDLGAKNRRYADKYLHPDKIAGLYAKCYHFEESHWSLLSGSFPLLSAWVIMFDNFSRIAYGHRVIWYIFCDDTARTDHAVLADMYAWGNDRVRSYPRLIFYDHRGGSYALFYDWFRNIMVCMVEPGYSDVLSQDNLIPNKNGTDDRIMYAYAWMITDVYVAYPVVYRDSIILSCPSMNELMGLTFIIADLLILLRFP